MDKLRVVTNRLQPVGMINTASSSFSRSSSSGIYYASKAKLTGTKPAQGRGQQLQKTGLNKQQRADRRPCWTPAGRALPRRSTSKPEAKSIKPRSAAAPRPTRQPGIPRQQRKSAKPCTKRPETATSPRKKTPQAAAIAATTTPRKKTVPQAAPVWRACGPCTSYRAAPLRRYPARIVSRRTKAPAIDSTDIIIDKVVSLEASDTSQPRPVGAATPLQSPRPRIPTVKWGFNVIWFFKKEESEEGVEEEEEKKEKEEEEEETLMLPLGADEEEMLLLPLSAEEEELLLD